MSSISDIFFLKVVWYHYWKKKKPDQLQKIRLWGIIPDMMYKLEILHYIHGVKARLSENADGDSSENL